LFVAIFFAFDPAYSNELPDGINEFVHSYLNAAKNNDIEEMEKLTHNAFIKCSAKSKKEYLTQVLKKQIKAFSRNNPIMKITYKAYSAEDLKEMDRKLDEVNKEWPVEPEGIIIIMYSTYHKTSRMALTVVKDPEGWKWVHFCEKEKQRYVPGWLGGEEEF
jgi:hypothetical protein